MNPYDAWADQLYREGDVFAAVFLFYVNRGEPPGRAHDLAKDDQQEALIRAIRRDPETYHDYDHFRNTVREAAVQRAVDRWRKDRRELPWCDGLDVPAPEPPSDDQADVVRHCLEQLPPADRQLLEQHFQDRYTLDDLAGLLLPPDGRTDNARILAVWRRVRRVVQRFRMLLLAAGVWLPKEPARRETTP